MKTIHTIQRSLSEELRFQVGEYDGKEIVSVRVWFAGRDGEMRPTRRGVNVAASIIDEFALGVQKLQEAVNAESAT